jgi:hypothetical protein
MRLDFGLLEWIILQLFRYNFQFILVHHRRYVTYAADKAPSNKVRNK